MVRNYFIWRSKISSSVSSIHQWVGFFGPPVLCKPLVCRHDIKWENLLALVRNTLGLLLLLWVSFCVYISKHVRQHISKLYSWCRCRNILENSLKSRTIKSFFQKVNKRIKECMSGKTCTLNLPGREVILFMPTKVPVRSSYKAQITWKASKGYSGWVTTL